ncbi:hypothetical protein ACFOQM_23220 [Paenibacillus sp. GCM10012307]|uniref:Uncharacterized protein n=1 Tax=Paenibacillus roseus TaxID=2798579 RepID=A0A934MRD3_9BACL|nr:hypothetical protein [Paenibacillus roseus]MBJ6364136.1 hypothetical protein [Paenibacillus roseus]
MLNGNDRNYSVGFVDYTINQESLYTGKLTVTFGFEMENYDLDVFTPEKYADFMAKLVDVIREYNGESVPYAILRNSDGVL